MSLRDIKEILGLIDFRMKNGLELDSSICSDFEKKEDIQIIFFHKE